MTAVVPRLRSSVVGALACQRDSYLRTLETEVVSCIKWSPPPPDGNPKKSKTPTTGADALPSAERWLIEFADSVLFPEGGGQPSDQGNVVPISASSTIAAIPVSFVQRQGLRCVAHSPLPLSPGSQVRQEVDFKRRWDHMQQHTGQHLLSAIMDSYENLETVGWGMGADGAMNYVDLPRKPSEGELQAIQDKCNEIIRNNLPITVETPDDAESGSLPGDYDKAKGVVRVIRIGDLDRNTCCGTHLCQTSHVSLILLHHTQPVHSQNCRLFFTCGDRAIKLAATSTKSIRSIAQLLSSGAASDEVITSVKKLQEIVSEFKKKEKRLLLDIAKYEGDRVRSAVQAGKVAWVHHPTEGLHFINMVIFEAKDVLKGDGLAVFASGEDKKGGLVVITGEQKAVEAFVTKAKEAVSSIKGGGKGGRWQGKVIEWKKGELEALKELVKSEV